jgi:uracil-DNA glycosylase
MERSYSETAPRICLMSFREGSSASSFRFPKVLALGKTAGKALTGDSRPIEQLRVLRPAPNPYLGGYAEVRVTYHPSALPRNPAWSERFDEDVGWFADP